MCISREENISLLVCTLYHDAHETFETGLDIIYFIKKPKAHVSCHLIIARPSSMKLSAKWANQLAQPAFVCSVDVLIIRGRLELWRKSNQRNVKLNAGLDARTKQS